MRVCVCVCTLKVWTYVEAFEVDSITKNSINKLICVGKERGREGERERGGGEEKR